MEYIILLYDHCISIEGVRQVTKLAFTNIDSDCFMNFLKNMAENIRMSYSSVAIISFIKALSCKMHIILVHLGDYLFSGKQK